MAKSALLVIDVQQGIVERFDGDTLPRLRGAIDAARAAGLQVIHPVIGFRAGHPEISPRNKSFGAIAASRRGGDPGAEIHPDVAPQPGDIVVTKKRASVQLAGEELCAPLSEGPILIVVLGDRNDQISGVETTLFLELLGEQRVQVLFLSACASPTHDVHDDQLI